jgi:hypothetical protein
MCPSTRHPTDSGPQRSEDTRSGGPSHRLVPISGLGDRPPKHISGVVVGREARFQRLGPTAGGGAERGTSSRCWKIRVARPSWGGPVGRRSAGST